MFDLNFLKKFYKKRKGGVTEPLKFNIEMIPNDLGQNLDLEKWSLNKVVLLVKRLKDVEINIL